MKCKQVQKQAIDYCEGLLDQTTRARIEEHLQQCSECTQEFRDIRRTLQLLEAVPLQDASPEPYWPDFTSKVMRKIDAMETPLAPDRFFWSPRFRTVVFALAMLLVILGGTLFSTEILQKMFQPTEVIVQNLERQQERPTEPLAERDVTFEAELDQIAPEELIHDMLDADFALADHGTAEVFALDASDEMVYFLIDSLTDEQKERLLAELYHMMD